MSNLKVLQNLDRLQRIVTEAGIPSDYFIRFIQDRGGALTDLDAIITALQNDLAALGVRVDFLDAVEIVAGDYLSGGGTLGDDAIITIDHNTSGVVPGTYGDATHVPQFDVDEFGHITDVTEVAISGGGGGGNWWFQPPTAASMSLQAGDGNNLVLSDDPDVGLILGVGATPTGTRSVRMAYRTLTTKASDWVMTAKMPLVMTASNWKGGNLFIHDSVGGRVIEFGWRSDQTFETVRWAALNGARTTLATTTLRGYVEWFQIEHTGGNYICRVSAEGKNWYTFDSYPDTTHLPNYADRVGFGYWFEGTNVNIAGSVPYFSLTGPGV